MKNKLLITLLLIMSNSLFSQTIKEVYSNDLFISKELSGTIRLYENGMSTFTPFDKHIIDSHFVRLEKIFSADTMKIFNEDWSTTKLFPYEKIDLSRMTDTVTIKLDTSNFYCSPSDYVYSPFGPRRGRQHKGIDTDLNIGDTLRSMFDGKIRYAAYNNGGFGNLVIIRHFNGLETYYAHQSELLVNPGDIVNAGDVIGLGGETGNALGPHLHFEIRYMDNAFDPEKILDIQRQRLKSDQIILTKDDFKWIKKWRERKYHKVKSGDTLGHLAVKYNTSVKKILKINKSLSNESVLQIGQKIRVR